MTSRHILTTRYKRHWWRVVTSWQLVTAIIVDKSSQLTTHPEYNCPKIYFLHSLSPFTYAYLCTLVYFQNNYHSLTHTYTYFIIFPITTLVLFYLYSNQIQLFKWKSCFFSKNGHVLSHLDTPFHQNLHPLHTYPLHTYYTYI